MADKVLDIQDESDFKKLENDKSDLEINLAKTDSPENTVECQVDSSIKSKCEMLKEESDKIIVPLDCATEEKRVALSPDFTDDLKEWAKPVSNLWQFTSKNFIAEQKFNIYISEYEPYCAVCTIFKPFEVKSDDSIKSKEIKNHELPSQSAPWMPELSFAQGGDIGQTAAGNPLIDDNGESLLLRCEVCKVCVHASCYGIKGYQAGSMWKCSRCKKNEVNAECCLCSLRGGALKPTTDGQWVHLMCAIMIPEVVFQDVLLREPVIVKRISFARIKLKCVYCYQMMLQRGSTRGACIQCFSGKCTLSFHITCAYIAGLKFETCDGPSTFYVSCSRHTNKKTNDKKRTLTEVKVGDFVVAKHRNNRFYKSEVIDVSTQINYEIEFEDGTLSDNRVPSDVQNRDCEKFGPPLPEEQVRVRWIDGVIYSGTFKREVSHRMLTVEFEDGARSLTKREDVYSENEELPKRVRSRMSEATEMKHEFCPDGDIPKKRQRVANLRYMSNGIILL